MMFSTAPSFLGSPQAQAPGLADILNRNYNMLNTGIQPSQNGGNINGMIAGVAPPPPMSQPMSQLQRNMGPINTGPSRTIMGGNRMGNTPPPQNRVYGGGTSNGMVKRMPFGGTNYDSTPGSLSYQGPAYANNTIGGGNNLWQTFNKMANNPNQNNLIY